MTEKFDNQTPGPDPLELAETMKNVAEKSQSILQEFLTKQSAISGATNTLGHADPLNVGKAFLEMSRAMMGNPTKLAEAQINFWRQYGELWQKSAQQFLGQLETPSETIATEDKRFRDPEWETNAVFSFIKESYLLSSQWLLNTVHDVDGLDENTARKVDFYSRQFIDAMAPTNFAASNPEVLRATLESKGENLVSGFQNLLEDLDRGDGQLRIKMVDEDAFTIGENIATTPGEVIYQNELMQLIQYKPTTKTVYRRPLLIIPPWINKFYILDLRPKNSFIRWAVEQGHTVFVISWVNPDETLATKTMEDYMFDGPLAALDAIEQVTGQKEMNVIGYCLGGTLLAATLAYMTEKGDDRIHAATYFTAMIDFAEAGELGVFVDEEQLGALEDRMNETGYLEGHEMATTFNMMRANDLIWSFVINNYLLGKEPLPFDLLYWNSDSTRMPAAMHSFYLRNMYLENKLIEPGGIEFDGIALDLKKINTPTFVLSTREDHIAPWKSTYRAVDTYGGPVKFCLAASGHIAGVINPPESNKYAYWTNNDRPASATDWFAGAKEHAGSWWPEWSKWIGRHGGGKEPARQPGDGDLDIIESAPGSYVKSRS
jgi:polyhydroxyalkanoate synthase subunit PhaC